MLIGPISTWDAKSQYLYRRSLERYLCDPDRKQLHEDLKDSFRRGEFGRYEGIRIITHNNGMHRISDSTDGPELQVIKMTREELNKLLNLYANAAYWHGEETGDYGDPDPEIHKEVESKIWNAITSTKKPKHRKKERKSKC